MPLWGGYIKYVKYKVKVTSMVVNNRRTWDIVPKEIYVQHEHQCYQTLCPIGFLFSKQLFEIK